MKSDTPSYRGYRFPPEIISHAVWLYHRFCVSFQDAEDLLAQRGITVSYEAIRLWCLKFGPEYARGLKRRQGRPNMADSAVFAASSRRESLRCSRSVHSASTISPTGTVKLTLREQACAAGVASPFESRDARDGVPSEERATP